MACITLLHNIDIELANDSINWILKTQKADGSWGFHISSTAEETAYCLQALRIWEKAGNELPNGRIEKGAHWLRNNAEPPYPWLWIGKTLYHPDLIIKSVILTTLELLEERLHE